MLCGQQSGYSSPIFQSTYLTTTFGKERHPTLRCGPPLSADSALKCAQSAYTNICHMLADLN